MAAFIPFLPYLPLIGVLTSGMVLLVFAARLIDAGRKPPPPPAYWSIR
jgi:hypothetical protein